MNNMEKTMELELNPYDRLVEGQQEHEAQAVTKESDLQGEHSREQTIAVERVSENRRPENRKSEGGRTGSRRPENRRTETATTVPDMTEAAKPVEIVPLSGKAIFNTMASREYGNSYSMEAEIEEDLLVPDTEPDMDIILNTSAIVGSAGFSMEDNVGADDAGAGTVRGELALEVLYQAASASADVRSNKLILLKNQVPFKRAWKENFSDSAQMEVSVRIRNIECRIINERKYRVKIRIDITAIEIVSYERKMFEDIRDEELEFLKETASILNIAFTKNKESEINENLPIDNDRIKPLKILKSSFISAENHRQFTGEKLVLNETIWVRILYLAEIASQGNLSSQPMLFQGKIDNTQFIPLDGSKNITACRISSDASAMNVQINDAANGFSIEGPIKTKVDFFDMIQRDIVVDFYNKNEDMACDNKEEIVCCGFETKITEQTVRETITMQQESSESQRIVYTDASVMETDINESNGKAEIKGKLQLEILTMTDSNMFSLAKKICEFSTIVDMPENSSRYVTDSRIFVREINADIANQSQINIMAQLQIEMDICQEGTIKLITNPCIVRDEDSGKNYPIIIYIVKENDTIWDIAKRYRVSMDHITRINKVDSISEGMKIVIAK